MLRALFHLRYYRYGDGSISTRQLRSFLGGLDVWWDNYHTDFFILLLCIALIAFTIEGMLYLRKKRNLLK